MRRLPGRWATFNAILTNLPTYSKSSATKTASPSGSAGFAIAVQHEDGPLRRGYQRTLEVDIASTEPGPATRQFLGGMQSLLGRDDAATVAGAVYALESTAMPELVMTYGWTQELFARMGAGMPDEVRIFFTSHINEIEVEHERRLRDACAARIDRPERARRFADGFESVLSEMDRWWSGLHAEALAECEA